MSSHLDKVLYLDIAATLNIDEHLRIARHILESVELDCHFDITAYSESIELRKKDGS